MGNQAHKPAENGATRTERTVLDIRCGGQHERRDAKGWMFGSILGTCEHETIDRVATHMSMKFFPSARAWIFSNSDTHLSSSVLPRSWNVKVTLAVLHLRTGPISFR